jgi:hypothetical protein
MSIRERITDWSIAQPFWSAAAFTMGILAAIFLAIPPVVRFMRWYSALWGVPMP